MTSSDPDVLVLGAGPNGLTGAATLAKAGLRVLVLEANDEVGGAVRTAEVTRPGFKHDVFSGFYPLFSVGPIGQFPLEQYGLRWCSFARPFAGATPNGPGVCVSPALETTRASFESAAAGDGQGYLDLWHWWERGGRAVLDLLFHPLGSPRALASARRIGGVGSLIEFARLGISPAERVAAESFAGEDARVWFLASPMHSDLGPDDPGGGLYGLVLLGLGQQVGMPIPEGGASAIPAALCGFIRDHGGDVLTGQRVRRIVVREGRAVSVETEQGEFPAGRAILATIEPQQLFLQLIGDGHLPDGFVRQVRRFRWGTGVFKLDIALSSLPEFTAPAIRGAGVLHLGRSVDDLRAAADQARRGLLPARPVLIAGIHTLADPSRAPAGQHTLWIETHVPPKIKGDAARRLSGRSWDELRQPFTDRVLGELERYAPGIRDLVLDCHAKSPDDLQAADSNLVGGDIAGGSFQIDQQLIFRPVPGWFMHRTPIRGLYMGGASTHPGGGVHGAAGANAARALLTDYRLADVREAAYSPVRLLANWLQKRG